MKFKHGTRRRALEYEKDILKYWKDNKTFEKSVEQRPESEAYVFYDGPPFITGVPHHGTLLSSIVKDAIPRYQTMKGKRVERRWGWDCHGLPAENFTEKKLGIKSRHEIGKEISLEKYITTCRDNMVQTGDLWEDTIDRIGRWVDFKGAYKTMDKDFMESVWWAFKTLYDKGKIYEGEKVLMYDTKWATPLSKAEVTMDAGAYQVVTDPSVYVKFKVKPRDDDLLGQIEERRRTLPADVATDRDRDAVRCIVTDEAGRIALLHSKEHGYYDLPGGGVEEGEDLETAAIREIKEELGCEVDNFKNLGKFEALLYENSDIKNTSHGFSCQLVSTGEPAFTEDELAEDFETVWVKDIDEAIELISPKNDQNPNSKLYPPTRDIAFLKQYKKITEAKTYLLAWTTTPWTLPANVVLAVNPEMDYVEVEYDGETLIMAKSAVEKVMTDEKHQPLDYKLGRELKGEELVNLQYKPLFENHGKGAHQVYAADYVSDEEGTGIVHTAPAYGEDDFGLARKYDLPVVHKLDEYGKFVDGDWQGEYLWDVNKSIAKQILADGKALKIDYIQHEYPHNPRTGERLIYRAHPSWFMDIDGQRQEMLDNNQPIDWFPEHIKNGRFAKTIEQAPDWNLSRDRFWATAMPVWEGVDEDGNKKQIVVGSYAELKELSGVELEDYHRPWVDELEFDKDGVHYKRIDKVIDGWFESGSMPFAQFHYPFENKTKFEASFPGDFITEYVGQVRAWFYYVHAVSTALFETNAFKNVIVTGVVAGNDGRKMSKSLGNYTDPNELMDKFSADSLRFLLLQSPLLNGEDFTLIDKDVADVARKLSMIWNMYDFFTMYAEVDDWEFDGQLKDSLDKLTNPLDRWIVSRLHQLVAATEQNMDNYNLPDALSPILLFIDDASNWYVRRSRRRFWKSEDDADKNQAYQTLHYVLTRLSIALAPFVPFLAEELYQKMTGGESVHLLDWLSAGEVDEKVIEEMAAVRELINDGLNQRAKEGIKVRQPLQTATIKSRLETLDKFAEILTEELNIKDVKFEATESEQMTIELDTELTYELRLEGLAREVIRAVQNTRKQAGLNVDDRIKLELVTEDENLLAAIKAEQQIIQQETLASDLTIITKTPTDPIQIDKKSCQIKLQKV